jgi:hypothetical protein
MSQLDCNTLSKPTLIIIDSPKSKDIFLKIRNYYDLSKRKKIFCYLYENCVAITFAGTFWRTYENFSFFLSNNYSDDDHKLYITQQDVSKYVIGECLDSFKLGRCQSESRFRMKALVNTAKELNINFESIEFTPNVGWHMHTKNDKIYIGFKYTVAEKNLKKLVHV